MPRGLEMREPVHAEFSVAEYERRVKKAMRLMVERGMDALLLTTEENIRYFAGGPLTELFQDKFNDFFLLLPADEAVKAALIMSHHRQGPCLPSWVPDQRFWGYDPSGSLMEMSLGIDFVAEVIREKGLAGAKLGMEIDNGLRLGMTCVTFDKLKARLPKATILSAADIVWPVRAIKSGEEIAKIRKACRITCDAFERGLEALRPGVRERELASVIRATMFEEGATGAGFLAVYAGEERGMWADAIASDYQLRKGDLVMFDGGCSVDGYFADVSRQASLG
ncbi:MAG: M24 family metallopeptidase, partial [Planctomycetota bacterium]